MDKIPSLIPNVVLIGNVNAGKSSLINKICQQNVSIVSDIAGTTTDEVLKRFELLDIGPINLIDTAGLNDKSKLGDARISKTKKIVQKASLILLVVDASNPDFNIIEESYNHIKKIIIFNKIDLLNKNQLDELKSKYPNAIFTNTNDQSTIDYLIKHLTTYFKEYEPLLLDKIDFKYKKLIHVIPVDSEAPKGRLILPQMQLIRECLDLDIISIVLKETELEDYINNNTDIDLIVTDSQVFKEVSKINKKRIPLTSYSILQARQKGDLEYFVESIKHLKQLKDNSKILIMESCSHNISHEDIGQVKIPKMLKEILDIKFSIVHKMSNDFPLNLEEYDFIIHCGGCMMTSKVMKNRINLALDCNKKMTNYGVFIAYYNNVLEEVIEIF